MTAKAMSLKSKINAYAKQNGIAAQVVLQNYMFERFLVRVQVPLSAPIKALRNQGFFLLRLNIIFNQATDCNRIK